MAPVTQALEGDKGWIFEPTPEHRCILPTQRELGPKVRGSIWKCGTCGTEYEVGYDPEKRIKTLSEAS